MLSGEAEVSTSRSECIGCHPEARLGEANTLPESDGNRRNSRAINLAYGIISANTIRYNYKFAKSPVLRHNQYYLWRGRSNWPHPAGVHFPGFFTGDQDVAELSRIHL